MRPLAAADAVEWASRRIDLAVLGAFLPAQLRRHLLCRAAGRDPAGQAEDQLRAGARAGDRPASSRQDDRPAVAKQVRQVTYWIIAAQLGIALALGIPGRAVMGLVGSGFTGGTAMLGFLLAAEVIAAAAVVSEAALIYVARTRNMIISLIMLALEAGLAAASDPDHARRRPAAGVPGDRPGDRPVHRAGLRIDHQVAAALRASSARRSPAGAGTSPGRPRRRRRRRRRSLSPAANCCS